MSTRTAAVFFVAITLLLTWPLVRHPASTALPTGPDGDLFVWTLAWNARAFIHQPLSIFDANIYHPLRHTLAFSENLIGSALFAAPIEWLTGNTVLALNVVALLSCVLCGLGAFVLARRIGIGPAGAIAAGLIFAFSPPRFFRTGQLHLAVVQWIPFALASLHAYLDKGRTRDVRLAAAFFTLQVLSSGHGAVFLLLAIGCLAAWRAVRGEPLAPGRWLRDLGVVGGILLVPSVLIYFPYRAVQNEMGLQRSLENWGVTPVSFLASPTHVQTFLLSLLPGPHVLDTASAFLFPGYLPLLLAAATLMMKPRLAERAESGAARGRSGSHLPAGTSPHESCDPPRTDGNAADRTRLRRSRLVQILVVILEIATAALFVIAVSLTVVGPTKLRLGSTVILSARSAWRPWGLFALAAAVRLALLPRVPADIRGRVRRAVGAIRRAAAALRRWQGGRRPNLVAFYGVLALVGVWLSIGPPLGLWQFVYWLPGLNFIRVPSRFMVLAVLGLAIVAGAGFDRLCARLPAPRRRMLAVATVVLLALEFAAVPLAVVPYRVDIPEADRWLASRPAPFAVAEVPLPDPMQAGPFERRQTMYMLHAMGHWQKTVHGYSGIRAPLHDRLYLELRSFPDEASLRELSDLGVGYVVVHTDLYASGEWEQVEARIDRYGDRLHLEHVAGAGRVYSLRSSAQE